MEDILNLIRFILLPLISGGAAGAFINNWLQNRRNDQIVKQQEEQKKVRRQKILASLLKQVEAISAINTKNETTMQPETSPILRVPIAYPIEPFEIAIFSENGVSVAAGTDLAVEAYLIRARELNTLIDLFNNSRLGVDYPLERIKWMNELRAAMLKKMGQEMYNIIIGLRESLQAEQKELIPASYT